MNSSLPTVTVVMPVLNEAAAIRTSLAAVLDQDYPADRLEILVVDGGSRDGTRAIVQELIGNRTLAHLLENPRRIQAAALNLGILAAHGAIIVRVDGHTLIAPDYISQCVHYLIQGQADNVGGSMRPVGHIYMSRAIALAMTSPFGAGDAKFHYSQQEQYVDTVYLGAFWRKTFDQIGHYDESLDVNEDYELNYRLRQAGGKILLSPSIKSTYTPRASLPELGRQYFRYGLWKVRSLQKHPESLRWRQVVAPGLVAALVSTSLGGFFWKPLYILFKLLSGCYLLANLVASTIRAGRGGRRYFPILPLVFATIHFAWGLGFWVGLALALLKPKQ